MGDGRVCWDEVYSGEVATELSWQSSDTPITRPATLAGIFRAWSFRKLVASERSPLIRHREGANSRIVLKTGFT